MKTYINKYKNHWISPYTIVDYMFFWTAWSKCSRNKLYIPNEEWIDTPKWADKLGDYLEPVSHAIQWVWDLVDRKIDYVKVDYWDVWSMDHTLSHIIVPMLKKLKEDKHGYGFIDDEDAPEHLRSDKVEKKEEDHGWDANAEARFDWVIDEMIWAFTQKIVEDDTAEFYDHTESNKEKDLMKSIEKLKVDRDGLKAHEDRKQNGYRLFGKYFQTLWS